VKRHQIQPGGRLSRRGVTLVEMLVAVALLLLMMTILVTVFASATGSITEQRQYAALDQELRRLETLIRQDLAGVTAKMTPPNDPRQNRGYFEYAENALADAQGEDSDDTLRFTAKAPPGRPFTGKVWVPVSRPPGTSFTLVPVTTTSDYAEIIYFLRNGNLYRRVFLIKPRELSGLLGVGNTPTDVNGRTPPPFANLEAVGFRAAIFRPREAFWTPPLGNPGLQLGTEPFVGWYAFNDISARPSAYPPNVPPGALNPASYAPIPNTLGDLTSRENRAFNPRFANDYVNDLAWISNGVIGPPDGIPDDLNADGVPDYYPTLYPNLIANPGVMTNETPPPYRHAFATGTPYDVFAFPFVFPNAYSQPATPWNAIHSLDPSGSSYNHNPIDVGDSLPVPDLNLGNVFQTWWGFPTYRETASPFWLDPIKRLNDPPGAGFFQVRPGNTGNELPYAQAAGLSWRFVQGGRRFLLPPLAPPFNRLQPYTDGAGEPTFWMPPEAVWEADLVATNVRSFDVKAYEPNPPPILPDGPDPDNLPDAPPAGYYDLGYGNLLTGTPPAWLGTFAHEGRMPPLTTDFRVDPQFPQYLRGDDSPEVVRLRRVWDSWSTTYTEAPALPLNPLNGPQSGLAPVMPSYPPPYPAPLRGIQVQVRMTSPDGRRAKAVTIRVDFTDKL
jgi:prepilin-type N-terminal cleavage/methylation domain-containing protein